MLPLQWGEALNSGVVIVAAVINEKRSISSYTPRTHVCTHTRTCALYDPGYITGIILLIKLLFRNRLYIIFFLFNNIIK